MEPVKSIEEAVEVIKNYKGEPSEFNLIVPDAINDPVGINMAIIGDAVLEKEWEPNGFEQKQGYRIYRFK